MSVTKRIRLLTSVAGASYAYAAGEVVDAPAEIADDLVKAQHAVIEGQAPVTRAERANLDPAKMEKRTSSRASDL